MSSGPQRYPDDSITAQAILLAVETGIEPDVWLAQDVIGMNTAMRYLRSKIKREAGYFGAKVRDGEASDGAGEDRQMSG
jgi:hypothetical protein